MIKRALLTCLMVLFFATSSFALSDVTIEWDANSEQDLAGYKLYQSSQSGVYAGNPVATIPAGTETVTLTNVPDGTWYWVLTAYDAGDNESGYSNEVTASLDTEAPAPPRNLLIVLIKKIIAWIINLFKPFRLA